LAARKPSEFTMAYEQLKSCLLNTCKPLASALPSPSFDFVIPCGAEGRHGLSLGLKVMDVLCTLSWKLFYEQKQKLFYSKTF